MPVRSEAARWLLLVVLALGVALMHHVPSQHAQPQAAATVHAEHSAHADRTGLNPADRTEPSHDGHDLLHLCLAIAVGFLALLAPRLHLLGRAAIERPRVFPAAATVPVPRPVPRRLAELCVLRL